jgi:hypothetical protein
VFINIKGNIKYDYNLAIHYWNASLGFIADIALMCHTFQDQPITHKCEVQVFVSALFYTISMP